MPFTFDKKSKGQIIRAEEWNELMDQIDARIDRKGDTMSGSLTIDGLLGVDTAPKTKLHIAGGNWDPNNSEGDLKIGNETHSLKIGLATGGDGAGDVRIRAQGGTNRLMLGGGSADALTIKNDSVDVAGELRLHLGEGLLFTQNLAYWGTHKDARIIRMLDSNGTKGNVDGGLVIEGFTPKDGRSRHIMSIRSGIVSISGNLDVTGRVRGNTSSRRNKRNITPLEDKDNFKNVLKLSPRIYTRPHRPDEWEIGYIAEEAEHLGLQSLLYFDDKGRPNGFDYKKLSMYLLEIVLEHERKLNPGSAYLEKYREEDLEEPDSNSKKAEIQKYLDYVRIPYADAETRRELLMKITEKTETLA